MEPALFADLTQLAPIVWVLLALFGGIGLVALISPARFQSLTRGSNVWVDTNKVFTSLDKKVDIDQLILPFSRALGLAVLIAVGVMTYLFGGYIGLW